MNDFLAALPPLTASPTAAPLEETPAGAPQLLLLGPVQVVGAAGVVEPTKKARLTELAAILATNPGCDHTTIDACYFPGQRVNDNARNTQISKLRRWLGKNITDEDYLPRYQCQAGYRLHKEVTSDWDQWHELLPAGPAQAPNSALEAALQLVRGRPFDGVRSRRYAWAETLKQQMISAIVDASYELARRRLMEGQWRGAEQGVVIGLAVEPGMERLWRARILAAYAAGNTVALQEAVDRLLAITDELGGDLEVPTEDLLEQLAEKTSLQLRGRRTGGHTR